VSAAVGGPAEGVPTPAPARPPGILTRRSGALPAWYASRQPILLAVLVLAIVAVPQTSLVLQRLVQAQPQAGPVTLIVWGLYAVPLLAAILTVDYFEREPWWLIAFAFAWGGLIATGLALSANDALQSILTTSEGLNFTTQWGAAIAGPTDEETLKGLGVGVCTLLATRRMRSPVDGFIIGPLSAWVSRSSRTSSTPRT
jgi:protease PrsW